MTRGLAKCLIYKQACKERTTQSLVGGKKWSSQDPHCWWVIQKRWKISQAWGSSLRSEELKPHMGHPSLGSGTKEMSPLCWFENQ